MTCCQFTWKEESASRQGEKPPDGGRQEHTALEAQYHHYLLERIRSAETKNNVVRHIIALLGDIHIAELKKMRATRFTEGDGAEMWICEGKIGNNSFSPIVITGD